MAMSAQRGLRRNGERGSLPLALLAAIIVAGIVVVLTVRIVATQNQVRFDESFHGSLPVAEAGINMGKFWLNNEETVLQAASGTDIDEKLCTDAKPSEFGIGCMTVEYPGEIEGNEYIFWLERLSEDEWEITSTGEDDKWGERRRVVGTMKERPLVEVALFAETLINFAGNNSADSYTSDSDVDTGDSWCTGSGYIASNGTLNMSGVSGGPCHTLNRTIDQAFLHGWTDEDQETVTDDDYPGGDRCVHDGGGGGANCRTVSEEDPRYLAPEIFPKPLDYGLPANVQFIEHALRACKATGGDFHKGTYDTSEGIPGILLPGELQHGTNDPDQDQLGEEAFEFPGDVDGPYHCFEHLHFDEHTKIDDSASSDKPIIIVVEKSVTLNGQGGGPKGPAHVGCEDVSGNATECVAGDADGEDASRPEAGRLWIFTDGEITFQNHSAFAGVMWGPRATCAGDAQAEIFGSLICGELPHNLGGWKFHYDEALAEVSSGEFFESAFREEFITD